MSSDEILSDILKAFKLKMKLNACIKKFSYLLSLFVNREWISVQQNNLLHCRISRQSCGQKYFITCTRKGVFVVCINSKYTGQPAYLRSFCVSWVGLLLSTFKINHMYRRYVYSMNNKNLFYICTKIAHVYSEGTTDFLILVLLNPDIPCLGKQCRSSWLWRSQLIWICTVCH